MVAIDDTASMTTNKSGQMALEALTMICKAMSRLEVGQLSVAKFGADMNLLHPFDQPFTDQAGPQIITQFPFEQDHTNMVTFLSKTVQISLQRQPPFICYSKTNFDCWVHVANVEDAIEPRFNAIGVHHLWWLGSSWSQGHQWVDSWGFCQQCILIYHQ